MRRARERELRLALGFVPALAAALLAGAAIAVATLAPGPARAQIVLELPEGPIDASVFRATGSDPQAPRPLVLWRRDGEVTRRLAETRSTPDGRFDFGLTPLPLTNAEFAATGRDEPAPTERSRFRPVERSVPRPVIATHDEADDRLVVQTARPDGELEISDATTGRLLARIAVVPTRAGTTELALEHALPRERPSAIAIVQVLPDARRSAPEVWRLTR